MPLRQIDVKMSEPLRKAILEYRDVHGFETVSAAVRDLIRRQIRWDRWQRSRRGRDVTAEHELRRLAEKTLQEHPDATESQLGYHIMRKAGRIVNAKLIEKVSREKVGKGGNGNGRPDERSSKR